LTNGQAFVLHLLFLSQKSQAKLILELFKGPKTQQDVASFVDLYYVHQGTLADEMNSEGRTTAQHDASGYVDDGYWGNDGVGDCGPCE
jgi:hypothetical protein